MWTAWSFFPAVHFLWALSPRLVSLLNIKTRLQKTMKVWFAGLKDGR
jgi:hypothetical protein